MDLPTQEEEMVLDEQEMEASPELEAVQAAYLELARTLWNGTDPLEINSMEDRDIFDFLGFD